MKKNRLKIKIKGKQYARPFYIQGYRSAWPYKWPFDPARTAAINELGLSGLRSGKSLQAMVTAYSGYADALTRRRSEIDFKREYMHEPVPYAYDPDAPGIRAMMRHQKSHHDAAILDVNDRFFFIGTAIMDTLRLDRYILKYLPDPETYPSDRFRMAGLVPLPDITRKFDPAGSVTIQDHFFRKVTWRDLDTGSFIYSWEKE